MTALTETNNAALLERAERVMPGGVLASFTTPADVAFVVREAHGSTIINEDGRPYVDYVMGSGPLILGHRHPRVVEAIERQLASGTHYYTLNKPAIELAETLVEAIPCAELVKFTSTGAEATFQALRIARAATGRDNIMRFRAGYHGAHDYGVAGATAGIAAGVTDRVLVGEFNDIENTVAQIRENADQLAAVIVEPFQRNIAPAPGFLEALREITRLTGVVLIFDEVVTGFRLGWGGAQGRYGVSPDLATYGKIIGGGLPLGAVAGSRRLMDLASPGHKGGDAVYFSSTLNGNPLAAAAGLATLEVLREPGVYDALESAGARLRIALADAVGDSPKPIFITGVGAMVGLNVGSGDPLLAATHHSSDAAARKKLETEMIRRGAFVNLGARLYVSTEHSDSDIQAAADALRGAVATLV